MKIATSSSKKFSMAVTTGLTLAATITTFCLGSLPNAQAQIPDGLYEVRSNGQIFFNPANGSNPVVVYNGSGKAVAIIRYGGAVYTAFDRGYIYRSPDGQDLGGGGRTSHAHKGSGTVNRMQCIDGNVVTSFVEGGVYQSQDGNNLGGGGKTRRLN